MILVIAIGLGASVGAICRYLLDQLIQHQHDMIFPLGTFAINVIGSFVLGLTTGLAAHHGLPSGPTLVIGVGLCGGFTTWSTYCWESFALAESGALGQASLNVVGSLAAGLAAAAAGFGLALL
jgi:fluoride exporter